MKLIIPFKHIFPIGLIGAFLAMPFSTEGQEDAPAAPKFLTIIRESVKTGHNTAHAKNEHDWAQAFQKADHPYHYLGMTSMTGPNQAWFVIPYASQAAMGDDLKRFEDNPLLSTESDRLSMEDAHHIHGVTVTTLAFRPSMSMGPLPDPATIRYVTVETWFVRPGYWSEFEAVTKAYIAARKRAGVEAGFAAYELVAGMAGPAFVFLGGVGSLAELDQGDEQFKATMAAATPEEQQIMNKSIKEAVVKIESNWFRVDPKMSYMSAETREKAPDFWDAK